MSLPIRLILWAGNNAKHVDHLHVEGNPAKTGTPPLTNPGKTAAVAEIYAALEDEFGTGYYFQSDEPAEPNWSNMGWYNRRHIDNDPTKPWSQHAYANALDIGPYYGVEEQQKFYDYLTKGEDMSEADRLTEAEVNAAIDWNAAFGTLKRTTQQELMRKLVAMAQAPPEDGDGIQSGDAVKITKL